MFSINTSIESFLSQIPSSTDKAQVMPPLSAMRVFRPVLCQHADFRAVDLFEHWVSSRQMDISLEQLACLWIHCESVFIKELPSRFTLWASDLSVRSPYQLGIDFSRLIVSRRWSPWVLRKSATLLGRFQVKVLKALGNFLMFVVFFWMALGSWMTLGAVREPLLTGLTRLGFA